jgi:hypothetical protein
LDENLVKLIDDGIDGIVGELFSMIDLDLDEGDARDAMEALVDRLVAGKVATDADRSHLFTYTRRLVELRVSRILFTEVMLEDVAQTMQRMADGPSNHSSSHSD